MWMAGVPYEPSQLVASAPDDVEFNTEDLVVDVDSATPRPTSGRSSRFQVTGPPPVRPPFNRALVNDQGPTREVARVGRDGRFSLLFPEAERPRSQPSQSSVRAEHRTERTEPRPRQQAVQEAKIVQERTRIPTIYERLRGPNPFE